MKILFVIFHLITLSFYIKTKSHCLFKILMFEGYRKDSLWIGRAWEGAECSLRYQLISWCLIRRNRFVKVGLGMKVPCRFKNFSWLIWISRIIKVMIKMRFKICLSKALIGLQAYLVLREKKIKIFRLVRLRKLILILVKKMCNLCRDNKGYFLR